MSGQSTGKLNPVFKFEDEGTQVDKQELTAEDPQIIKVNGVKLGREEGEESVTSRNTYSVCSKGEHDVTVTVVVNRHNKKEADNSHLSNEPQQCKADDIRITILGTDDFKNEVPGIAPTQTVYPPIPSNGTSSNDSTKILQNKLSQSLRLSLSTAENHLSLGENDEDTKWLAWIEVKLKDTAGDVGEIDLEKFKKVLGVKNSFFAERFFELLDLDSAGTVKRGELMGGLRMLTKGTPEQKLQFLFDVYDVDATGSIGKEVLMADFKACMDKGSLSLTDDNLKYLSDVVFGATDKQQPGMISFEELRSELDKHPGVMENLTSSALQWLKPQDNSKKKMSRLRYFTVNYLRHNYRKIGYLLSYWILNITLCTVTILENKESNTWNMIARGAGVCLNFNCMWVLVLVLRNSITFLRMTQLVHILPLDQHILFHKMTGWTIVGLAFIHAMAHIASSAFEANVNAIEMWEVLFTVKADVGYVNGSAFITGWLLVIILAVMVICSLPFLRRVGNLQVFHLTHMLYGPFWILVLLHGPHFWKWFMVPGVLFIIEKVLRSKFIKMVRYGDTYIEEVNLLPSSVTHLVITRPTNFRYKPGDYIFIQIPEIATYEWHQFTISSAPEMEGHIWLHIRSVGHWTNKLYKYFDNLEVADDDDGALESGSTTSRALETFEMAYLRRVSELSQSTKFESNCGQKPKQKHKIVRVKCYVDGPYGTGTRGVFDTDHAVLIGAGIGVTPMASILQSVWYRFNAVRQTCPNCEHTWHREEDISKMKLKKVDFIWINRDQKSFEWFLTLLDEIELEQQRSHQGVLKNGIQMHLYMTGARKKNDIKGIGFQIALDLMYNKSQRDLITGLRTKTEPGRPDWNKIFKAVKAENKESVKVFFCGPPALGKTVKKMSAKYNFAFSKENF